MAVAALPSLLTEVETAVGASRPDAVDAAVKAFRAKAPPLELVRAAARGVASHYDRASGVAPRSLAILGAAANLTPVMEPRFQVLPVLQAIAYAASEKKPATPAKPPRIVSGEVTHLGRSFLFAVRAGDVAEAESIFLGMVDEGWERKMAGDMLFRTALEDMGEGGRKLFLSVKSWQLARAIGFKDARRILRPAVDYLVKGPRDRTAFETILAVLGKEWVDLEALSSDGYAASVLAEGLVVAAARRLLTAKGYDTEAARRFLFAHASRFVLNFSRTSERLYVLFQAALRVRSPEPKVYGEVDEETVLSKLDLIANLGSRDSPIANEGYNLLLADACITEFVATKSAPIVLALARMTEASPKDQAAYKSWAPLFGL